MITYDKDSELGGGTNDKEKGSANCFVNEVDNFSEAGLVRNALFGPLIDGDGNVTGCLQLLNKVGRPQFDETDLEEFQTVLGVIGTTVKNANESFNILNLTISLLGNIHSIKTLFSEDITKLAQLNEVQMIPNIKLIKDELANLTESKKKQFFADGTMLEEVFSQIGTGTHSRLSSDLFYS